MIEKVWGSKLWALPDAVRHAERAILSAGSQYVTVGGRPIVGGAIRAGPFAELGG